MKNGVTNGKVLLCLAAYSHSPPWPSGAIGPCRSPTGGCPPMRRQALPFQCTSRTCPAVLLVLTVPQTLVADSARIWTGPPVCGIRVAGTGTAVQFLPLKCRATHLSVTSVRAHAQMFAGEDALTRLASPAPFTPAGSGLEENTDPLKRRAVSVLALKSCVNTQARPGRRATRPLIAAVCWVPKVNRCQERPFQWSAAAALASRPQTSESVLALMLPAKTLSPPIPGRGSLIQRAPVQ